ncbi:MAG: hypothetical protein UT91_C0005G0020 [Parcubacteria group bacterium GW2011_GWA2_40_23]|nr:MAG: hypothetical protein UT91_C0005G0020 [Parcubacteria group bacterium GW2011_GWA2_40_23]
MGCGKETTLRKQMTDLGTIHKVLSAFPATPRILRDVWIASRRGNVVLFDQSEISPSWLQDKTELLIPFTRKGNKFFFVIQIKRNDYGKLKERFSDRTLIVLRVGVIPWTTKPKGFQLTDKNYVAEVNYYLQRGCEINTRVRVQADVSERQVVLGIIAALYDLPKYVK